MFIQFGKRVSTIRTDREAQVSVPLGTSQLSPSVGLTNPGKYSSSALFTVIVKDLDAPRPYCHLLIINANKLLEGDVIIPYEPPQVSGHRYVYEIYEQPRAYALAGNFGRTSVNLASVISGAELRPIARITITTRDDTNRGRDQQPTSPASRRRNYTSPRRDTSPSKLFDDLPPAPQSPTPRNLLPSFFSSPAPPTSPRNTSPVSSSSFSSPSSPASSSSSSSPVASPPVSHHAFVSSSLPPRDQKECACRLHVAAKSPGVNPYAICKKSTGGNARECVPYYDWDNVPYPELLAFVRMKGIFVSDPNSRQSITTAIRSWQSEKGE